MQCFLPLVKADQVNHLVYARAAVEEPDKAGEIMDYLSAVPMFKAWSKQYEDATGGKSFGNVRAMHNPRHLAGKVEKLDYDDDGKCIGAMIKVLDPTDWIKVEEGGYTGISIGGGYARKWADPMLKGFTRYTPRISEISFVDSPCIPSARILELQKIDGTIEEVLLKGTPRLFDQLVSPRTFDDLNKVNFTGIARGVGRLALAPTRAVGAAGKLAGGLAGLKIGARRAARSGGSLAEQGESLHRTVRVGSKVGHVVGTTAGLAGTAAGAASLLGRKKKPEEVEALKQELLDTLAKVGAGAILGTVGGLYSGTLGGLAVAHSTRSKGLSQKKRNERGEMGARIGATIGGATGLTAGLLLDRKHAREQNGRFARGGASGGNSRDAKIAAALRTQKRSDFARARTALVDVGRRMKVTGAMAEGSKQGVAAEIPRAKRGIGTRLWAALSRKGGTAAANVIRFAKQELLDNLAKASTPAEQEKIRRTMHEFKRGGLRSWRGVNEKGTPRKGPKVTDRRQAIAIALSQAARLGKSDDSAFVMAIADQLSKAA